MKRGFTLVELSIVLVIIGLLIGGILVAQSMIQTVKIQRLTRDLLQYDVAVHNFLLNYKMYPGDSSLFSPPGNNNGIIDGGGGCVGTLYNFEGYQAFAHLSQAGMIDKSYQAYSPILCLGSHNNNIYNTSNAGLIAPYNEINSTVATFVGRGKKSIIDVTKPAVSANLRLYLVTNSSDVLPLESKLGLETFSSTAIGLTNSLGAGMCYTAMLGTTSCVNASAIYGSMYYFVTPIDN